MHVFEEESIDVPVLSMMSGDYGDERRRKIGGCSSISRLDKEVLSMVKPYTDDLTGTPLDSVLVEAAIVKELSYFEEKEVWKLVPISEARRITGKDPITVRWVHTNKGDDITPNLRARLVAREMKNAGDEAIFAPTPPLETLRTVLSLATTRLPGQEPPCTDPESEQRIQISLVDISRAYFNAKIDQSKPEDQSFVDLPPEHPEAGKGLCGRLLRHVRHKTCRVRLAGRTSTQIHCY